ncbi:hypothetical protein QDY63_22390 [Pseudomonas brenneri]|uniref:hypothetical protein n=1 Tax=Pseudomonas fluorescens group TaxID=136843 RepID=UPI000518634E|nr:MULTISPECIES: hypothetical protein [Pseudomonas fluorescens group]WJM90091.1 hypothetical protein QDY63_22390 [Pseudomonas brenneri]
MGGIGEAVGGMIGGAMKGIMDAMGGGSKSQGQGQGEDQPDLSAMLAQAGDNNPVKIGGE